MDEGEGSTNLEQSLLVFSEGRIPLSAPKEKDRDATVSSGEERGPNDARKKARRSRKCVKDNGGNPVKNKVRFDKTR